MKFINKIFLALCLTLLIAISGCQTNNTEITPVQENEAYPISIEEINQPDIDLETAYPGFDIYEIVENDIPDELVVPTPNSNTGVITGKLYSQEDKQPFIGAVLYLGRFLQPDQPDENAPKIIRYTQGVDPQAEIAKDGTFIFKDIEPNEYILLLWTPMNIMPVTNADTLEEVSVTAKAGEIIDLGIIYLP